MAYDLVVSKEFDSDNDPKYLGFIDLDDYDKLERISAKTKHSFFDRLQDPYKDEKFDVGTRIGHHPLLICFNRIKIWFHKML